LKPIPHPKMPESIVPALWNDSTPKWLPSPIDLAHECTKLDHGPSHRTLHQPAGSDAAFVKWGPMVAMSEARTQEFLAKQVNEDGNGIVRIPVVYFAFRYEELGYIVMQYVGDRDCNKGDFPEIALALERLLQIPSPTSVPGPFNGGAIMHRFFAESMSSVPYSSVELLEEHINAILARRGYKSRAHFVEKAGIPLPICLDDLHWGNFRISSSGLIFSIDHARTNFLPLAFRHFTFAEGNELAMMLKKPLNEVESKLLGTMRLASGELQVSNDSRIALPKSLADSLQDLMDLLD